MKIVALKGAVGSNPTTSSIYGIKMIHDFDVVLEGMYSYPAEKYSYRSNTHPDHIYHALTQNNYWRKFYEDAFEIRPEEKEWFFNLSDRNPYFATDAASEVINSEDKLYDELVYIDLTFQVAKAFFPNLWWSPVEKEAPTTLCFHGRQRLVNAV